MHTVPVRVIKLKDWKPISDEIIQMNIHHFFTTMLMKTKAPGGYWDYGHAHWYKVDGFDYDEAFKRNKCSL